MQNNKTSNDNIALENSKRDNSFTEKPQTDKLQKEKLQNGKLQNGKLQNGKLQNGKLQLKDMLSKDFPDAKFPDSNTVVTGKLNEKKVIQAAKAGIEHIINLQPESELTFDEKKSVEAEGLIYTHIPIEGAKDLKQLKLLEFDKALRTYHGKKTLIHCGSGNRVGACMALRAGWLRGRKMDTAMQRGKDCGLDSLEEEVRMRLLVPR